MHLSPLPRVCPVNSYKVTRTSSASHCEPFLANHLHPFPSRYGGQRYTHLLNRLATTQWHCRRRRHRGAEMRTAGKDRGGGYIEGDWVVIVFERLHELWTEISRLVSSYGKPQNACQVTEVGYGILPAGVCSEGVGVLKGYGCG